MTFQIQELPWLEVPPADFRSQCSAIDASHEPSGAEIAALAGKRLSTDQLTRLSKSIERARTKAKKLPPLSEFHLGLLGNGTTCLFATALAAGAARHGVLLQITQADYDQVVQEALDPSSTINSSKPDAILLALDFHGLPFHSGGNDGPTNQSAIDYVGMIREGLERGAGAPVIFQTVACPPQPLFGSLDSQVSISLRRQIQDFNDGLRELAKKRGDYILDIATLAESIGTQNWHDPVQWNLYKLPFAQTMVPVYVEYVGRLLGAIRGNARKCLVLDLDNTLWGGVIGDDGLEGIVLGQGDGVGEAYAEIQRTALNLRDRGVILAVSSKNSDEVARQPFLEHPEMLLKLEHIAVFQANWSDKATNIEAIATTLNIGLDSLVLLDDNPVERSQVRKALPMVAVPELPADPSLYARALLNAGYFEAVTFSEEDRQRAALYQANARRAELSAKSRDMDEFLASLGMTIEFHSFDAVNMGRISQLINKTNQFNLTTRRYTHSEVETISKSPDCLTFQIRLRDRFGDNGIIGVVIARKKDAVYDIDTWLMSCRVLGRRVEEAIVAELVRHSRLRGVGTLEGSYLATAKNGLVRDLYRKLGFARSGGTDDHQVWKLDVSAYNVPSLPFEFVRDSEAKTSSAR